MVYRYGSRYAMETYLSRLEPYPNGRSMDSDYSSSNRYENNAQQAHVT